MRFRRPFKKWRHYEESRIGNTGNHVDSRNARDAGGGVRVVAFRSAGKRGAKKDWMDVISDWGDQHDSIDYGCVEQEKVEVSGMNPHRGRARR